MPVATILLWGKNLLNNWIEPISAIIGIITFVPILMTLYEVKFGRKYKYAGWFNQVKNSTGSRPAIFIIDLKPNADIRTQVQKAIEADEKLKSIPNDRIFQVCRSEMLSPKDMPDLEYAIRAAYEQTGIAWLYCLPLNPSNSRYQVAKKLIEEWKKK